MNLSNYRHRIENSLKLNEQKVRGYLLVIDKIKDSRQKANKMSIITRIQMKMDKQRNALRILAYANGDEEMTTAEFSKVLGNII